MLGSHVGGRGWGGAGNILTDRHMFACSERLLYEFAD